MSKNKSIHELLSSIESLINEARSEYEFTINKDLPKKIDSEIEIVQKQEKTEVKEKSSIVLKSDNNFFEEKQENRINNWKNINFEKKIKKTTLKSFSTNSLPPSNEKIEVEFRLLLDSWLKRNLNKLIELEISNYIKNRQN